ncbi:hypothetical protein OKW39_005789 [Paraburkholderia sp. MM6662-R1]
MEVGGRVGQLHHLARRRFDDALLAVTHVHAPQARKCVEQFIAVDIAQIRALAGFEYGGAARFVRAIVDDRVNQVLAVGVDQR